MSWLAGADPGILKRGASFRIPDSIPKVTQKQKFPWMPSTAATNNNFVYIYNKNFKPHFGIKIQCQPKLSYDKKCTQLLKRVEKVIVQP